MHLSFLNNEGLADACGVTNATSTSCKYLSGIEPRPPVWINLPIPTQTSHYCWCTYLIMKIDITYPNTITFVWLIQTLMIQYVELLALDVIILAGLSGGMLAVFLSTCMYKIIFTSTNSNERDCSFVEV